MTPQIVINPDNFDADYAYNLAGKVFWKNFSYWDGALSLMPDMVQEAVKRMYELSGKVSENENGKYNKNYGYYWVCHNAMLSFYKAYTKSNKILETCKNVLQQYPIFNQQYRYYGEEGEFDSNNGFVAFLG